MNTKRRKVLFVAVLFVVLVLIPVISAVSVTVLVNFLGDAGWAVLMIVVIYALLLLAIALTIVIVILWRQASVSTGLSAGDAESLARLIEFMLEHKRQWHPDLNQFMGLPDELEMLRLSISTLKDEQRILFEFRDEIRDLSLKTTLEALSRRLEAFEWLQADQAQVLETLKKAAAEFTAKTVPDLARSLEELESRLPKGISMNSLNDRVAELQKIDPAALQQLEEELKKWLGDLQSFAVSVRELPDIQKRLLELEDLNLAEQLDEVRSAVVQELKKKGAKTK